ncbi:cation:proton antiporter [Leptolyngbya sp. KIOST-1]|uniref:cation:proton antiporter n=1 Tax=Leptolyngbya sp. KIOST-1 TaxID=1229172 RepID=UPI00068F3353|nr:sodium:proton antiporter [Leptolyngbya sp. KIOST-1]
MEHNPLLTIQVDLLILLLLASLAAVTLTRVQFPYTVGLVLLGLLLGGLADWFPALAVLNTFNLSHDLILFVFVPPLIFESAINLDGRLLLRNLLPVLVLAGPGLLISTAIVGAIVAWGTPLTLGQALLFGSLISATDPVAVIALFKELGAPKQLSVLVEGESLFNDATAIVTFNIILALVLSGAPLSGDTLVQGGFSFLVAFAGGLVVGAVLGFLGQFPLRWARENRLVLSTLSLVFAYGTFLLAEEVFGVSGVIAIVSAGLVVGWLANRYLDPDVKAFGKEFWEYVAFLANSLIFLLVGITAAGFDIVSQLTEAGALLAELGVAVLAILVSRAVVVFGLTPLINRFQPHNRVSWPFQVVSYWGGLRGAVCLALALSFDPQFPNRDLMVLLTLGVALFTLFLPGTTISRLMQGLGLDQPPILEQVKLHLGRIVADQQALQDLAAMKAGADVLFAEPIDQMEVEQRQTLEQSQQSLRELAQRLDLEPNQVKQLVGLIALSAEKAFYRRVYDAGLVAPNVLNQMNLLVALKSDAVKRGAMPPDLNYIDPVELRLQNLRYRLTERYFPNSKALQDMRSHLLTAQYAYHAVQLYAAQQVYREMQYIATAAKIPDDLLQSCLEAYQQSRTEALAELERIAAENPAIGQMFLRNTLEQVTQRTRAKVVKDMQAEGLVSIQSGA